MNSNNDIEVIMDELMAKKYLEMRPRKEMLSGYLGPSMLKYMGPAFKHSHDFLWPSETSRVIFVNGEDIHIFHRPSVEEYLRDMWGRLQLEEGEVLDTKGRHIHIGHLYIQGKIQVKMLVLFFVPYSEFDITFLDLKGNSVHNPTLHVSESELKEMDIFADTVTVKKEEQGMVEWVTDTMSIESENSDLKSRLEAVEEDNRLLCALVAMDTDLDFEKEEMVEIKVGDLAKLVKDAKKNETVEIHQHTLDQIDALQYVRKGKVDQPVAKRLRSKVGDEPIAKRTRNH